MSKRKVTDLLPCEAILISSDADLKVLEEFEKAGVMWLGGRHRPTERMPKGATYPFYLHYGKYQISWSSTNVIGNYTICLATDFIPTESNELDWKKIAEQLSVELEKVAEFFKTHNKPDNTFGSFVSKQIGFTEIAESVNQTLLKTRNTPNQ